MTSLMLRDRWNDLKAVRECLAAAQVVGTRPRVVRVNVTRLVETDKNTLRSVVAALAKDPLASLIGLGQLQSNDDELEMLECVCFGILDGTCLDEESGGGVAKDDQAGI